MIAIVNVNKSWGIGRDGDLLVNIPEDMKYFRTVTAGSTVIMGRKTLESFPGMKPLKGRINVVLTKDPSRIKKESIEAADACYVIQTADEPMDDILSTAVRNAELTKTGAKASEKRTLLVVLKTKEEVLKLASHIEAAVKAGISADSASRTACGEIQPQESCVFIIGGASVYKLFLSDCCKCLVTKNNSELNADSYFPNLDENEEWELSEKGETRTSENGIEYEFDTYVKREKQSNIDET